MGEMQPRVFGAVTVRLVNDTIAARKADVLVNAANDQLSMGVALPRPFAPGEASRSTRKRYGTRPPGSVQS
jgi:hypothetical protein